MLDPPAEGTDSRVAFDAVHAEWHHPECPPECDDFLVEWYEGREFTAEDLMLAARAVADDAMAPADDDEAAGYKIKTAPMPGYPITTGTPTTGTGGYHVYTKTGTTTSVPHITATRGGVTYNTGGTVSPPKPPKMIRQGDRKGRAPSLHVDKPNSGDIAASVEAALRNRGIEVETTEAERIYRDKNTYAGEKRTWRESRWRS